MAGLRVLPAIGALYCLAAGWSQWRPLDIPGTHLPYSTMQLLIEKYKVTACMHVHITTTTSDYILSAKKPAALVAQAANFCCKCMSI